MSSMVKFLILKPILFKIFSDISGMIGAKKIAIFAIIMTKIFKDQELKKKDLEVVNIKFIKYYKKIFPVTDRTYFPLQFSPGDKPYAYLFYTFFE